ncbi:MAG: ATP-binding protein [Methanobacterium paludis]|nr:ATP-binding protein [Methanobacterium paludis]
MILESISLENWKKFRNPVEIQFKDGLNVVYGPNESGKTTLMDSLRTTLFSKHSSRAKNIKSIVPWSSQLAPQARITFRNNGDRYRITMRNRG